VIQLYFFSILSLLIFFYLVWKGNDYSSSYYGKFGRFSGAFIVTLGLFLVLGYLFITASWVLEKITSFL